jgi:hypothetical protein
MNQKLKKITVLLEEKDFTEFDVFCRAKGFKKSTLIARLLKEFMADQSSENAMQQQSMNEKIKTHGTING